MLRQPLHNGCNACGAAGCESVAISSSSLEDAVVVWWRMNRVVDQENDAEQDQKTDAGQSATSAHVESSKFETTYPEAGGCTQCRAPSDRGDRRCAIDFAAQSLTWVSTTLVLGSKCTFQTFSNNMARVTICSALRIRYSSKRNLARLEIDRPAGRETVRDSRSISRSATAESVSTADRRARRPRAATRAGLRKREA